MALLERVATLVRANLNDLVDKAEHPEKMIKQVILDMQNQLLQVKTQVAIAIADQHLLEKRQKENEDKVAEWMRKAELSVDKKQDDLARAALQRVESYRDLSEGFARAGDRSESASGKSENRATPTGTETDRGPGQSRPADRAASPCPSRRQSQRRQAGRRQRFQRQRLRPHEAQSRARRSPQPGQIRNPGPDRPLLAAADRDRDLAQLPSLQPARAKLAVDRGPQLRIRVPTDPFFRNALENTLKYAIVAVPLNIVFSLPVALGLNQIHRFRAFFRTAFFMPVVASAVAVSLLWTTIYDPQAGWLNAFLNQVGLDPQPWLRDPDLAIWSVLVAAVWQDLGYNILILLAGLQGIPDDFYDAAKVDGAGAWPSVSRTLRLRSCMRTRSSFLC